MPAQIFHADLYGTREHKYNALANYDASNFHWAKLLGNKKSELFVPQDNDLADEYNAFLSVMDIFPRTLLGPNSHRDGFAIAFDEEKAQKRLDDLADNSIPDFALRETYQLVDNRDWSLSSARRQKLQNEVPVRCIYRPFDFRFMLYGTYAFDYPRPEVNNSLLKPNLALISTKQTKENFAVLVCDKPAGQHKLATPYDGSYLSPLYIYSEDNSKKINISSGFVHILQKHTGLRIVTKSKSALALDDSNLPPSLGMFTEFHGVFNADLTPGSRDQSVALENTITPEGIFHYAYAIFHSPTYRERYAEFLKIDFPRLPLTSDVPLFRALSALGEHLTALHLMERTGPNPAAFPVTGSNSVDGAPKYDKDTQRVSINKTQYFTPVPPEVWAFQIGGYQVCHKWLKDRKGRTLTDEDITHYGSIVAALAETIRLMAEIDAVIEDHDGWPLQ